MKILWGVFYVIIDFLTILFQITAFSVVILITVVSYLIAITVTAVTFPIIKLIEFVQTR